MSTSALDGTTVITGGLGALGRAIAAEFLARGARVILTGRRDPAEVTQLLAPLGPPDRVAYRQAEATDLLAVDSIFTDIPDLRACVVNAGVTHPEPFLSVGIDTWRDTMRVNLEGSFLAAQAAARHMVSKNAGGTILLIGSWVQHMPDYGNTAYSVSKAGLAMLGRCMALELGAHNVRVNTLAPGIADAGMAQRHMASDQAFAERARRIIPLDRLQTAADVARTAAFLCSDDAAYMTGSVVLADGGASLGR